MPSARVVLLAEGIRHKSERGYCFRHGETWIAPRKLSACGEVLVSKETAAYLAALVCCDLRHDPHVAWELPFTERLSAETQQGGGIQTRASDAKNRLFATEF